MADTARQDVGIVLVTASASAVLAMAEVMNIISIKANPNGKNALPVTATACAVDAAEGEKLLAEAVAVLTRFAAIATEALFAVCVMV